MRSIRFSLFVLVGIAVACSSDGVTRTIDPPPPPAPNASVNLALSGSQPLFNSVANAINDGGMVVGWSQVLPRNRQIATVWGPPNYAYVNLPDDGRGTTSTANAIGRDGTIGGSVCNVDAVCRPVFWSGGTLHPLDGIGAVTGICPCDSHTLIGWINADGAVHGALWIDEVLIDVGAPTGFANAQLVSVAHGFIVGNAYTGTPTTPGPPTPFRWSPSGGWVPLEGGTGAITDVNASGTVVGGVIWPNGTNTATPIADGMGAAVNDSGVVAGVFSGTDPFVVPGTWTQATGWTMLGGDMNATITDINNAGAVVGFVHSGENSAMLWEP